MKRYNLILLTILSFFLLGENLIAQINFTNQSNLLPTTNYSGVAMGVTDVDGDDLDDIVRFSNNATHMYVLYQGDTTFTIADVGVTGSGKQWTLSIADTDHNGFGDILTGGYNFSQIDMTDAGGANFSTSNLDGQFFAQGSNFVDINNDGAIDVFVCNDDGESFMYKNDGTGSFDMANDWIDMSINGSSGEAASGNYGSVWTDFDNDGDTDLYIAKCRLGVSDATDERRINKLFVNDGNNNFSEQGEEFGLRIGWQSWTAEFQDIDNDGDFDCFITNHDAPSQLLLNDGAGHFTDITASSGIVVDGVAIQAFLRDFDNDGYVDLIVAGTEQYLYKNNGDHTFTEVNAPFDFNDMESCAIGDLNNDGHLDVYAGYAMTYNNPSTIPDALWINDGNANNWFKVHLVGTESNLDGIGARIEIHGDFGMQVREVRSGEGYGVTNSLIQHFGLSTFDAIDRVIVKWPSGIVDVIENPAINGLTEIIEGPCTASNPAIVANGLTSFCPGGSVELTAPVGSSYSWSNGATTPSITATESGNYSVVVDLGGGCYQWSSITNVTVAADETPSIAINGLLSFCEGNSVELTSSEANDYIWSSGEESQSIEVTETGTYTVTTTGDCGELTSSGVDVTVVSATAQAQASDVNVLFGEDATLNATGDNLRWYDMETDGDLVGVGPSITISNVTAPATYYVENSLAELDFMEPQNVDADNLYSGPNFNGSVVFDVESEILLKTVKVVTDTPAERLIELRNNLGEVLDSRLIDIPVGESRLELNFTVIPGMNYSLGTNTMSNNFNLGTNTPRLQRSENNVSYPYVLDNLVTITSSNAGEDWYYYFYDWEVQSPAYDCVDDRVAVNISVSSATIDIDDSNAIRVFPSPGNGLLQLELETLSAQTSLSISDVAGRVLLTQDLGTVNGLLKREIDATHFAPGTYILEVQTETERYFGKLIIE